MRQSSIWNDRGYLIVLFLKSTDLHPGANRMKSLLCPRSHLAEFFYRTLWRWRYV